LKITHYMVYIHTSHVSHNLNWRHFLYNHINLWFCLVHHILGRFHSHQKKFFHMISFVSSLANSSTITGSNKYSTAQLLHFYTRWHAWHHAVFCVLNAKVSHGKYLHVTGRGICTRRDMEFPWDKLYNLYETWSTKWHPRKNHNNCYCGVPRECSYLQLKLVSEYPVYIPFQNGTIDCLQCGCVHIEIVAMSIT